MEWRHAGLPCLIVRSGNGKWSPGHLCGYVGVPKGHPCYERGYDDLDVSAHGGLTYASKCADRVCHVPRPGETDDVWWLGFDCGHAEDVSPGLLVDSPHMNEIRKLMGGTYKSVEYVRAEVNRLAEQLAALK